MAVNVKKSLEEKRAIKAEKAKLAESERAAGVLEMHLKDLRGGQIGTPTIIRKVGERVQHGAIKQSIIKQVLDAGKIYLLDEIVTNHNYGRPFDTTRQMYVAWNEVKTYYSEEDINLLEKFSYRDEVRVYHSNSQISSIVHKYHVGIDMDPEYQRGDVWDLSDKIALIDSIFSNIDIGKFTLIRLPYSPTGPSYEILDGKQRLRALIDFIEGRFEYRGKKFYDLHPADRSHLENYGVLFAETEGLTLPQKCEYFLKLNTTGKPQDESHLERVRKLAKKA